MKKQDTYNTSDYARSFYSISVPVGYYEKGFFNQTAQIIIGDKKFLDILNKSIPVKTVFDNCGEGMHEFHFIFQVDKNGNAIECNIRKIINIPDGESTRNADYLIQGKTLINNIASKYQPAIYQGKNVNSLMVKELVIYVDKNGKSK
jgi:hypothetical protein